jgi:hypothetical protein
MSQTPFYEQEIQEAELVKARVYLADVAQSAQLADIKTETQALPGEPAPAILFGEMSAGSIWEPLASIL